MNLCKFWAFELNFLTNSNNTFYLIFKLLPCYSTFAEKGNSCGRADIIVETENYVYIFEFKLDGTAAETLKQIDDKGYTEPYAADSRKSFKVGVVLPSEKKNITGWGVATR